MRLSAIFAITAVLLAGALPCVASATENETLRAALADIPASIFTADDVNFATIVDMRTLTSLGKGKVTADALARLSLANDIRPLAAMTTDSMGVWSQHSGVSLEDLWFVAGYNLSPQDVSVWGLANQETADAVFEGLGSRGFSTSAFRAGVMSNGDDNALDFPGADRASPWKGPMGKTSAVAKRGSSLMQAANSGAAAAAANIRHSIASSSQGKVIISALEAQGGDLLTAFLFGPFAGLTAGDPAHLMNGLAENIRERVEALGEMPAGVPPYLAGALADIETDHGPQFVAVLSYKDCETAQKASASAVRLWQDAYGETSMLVAEASHVDAGEAGCAAVMSVSAEASDNTNYRRALGAFMRRDFPPVRIGPEL